MKKQKLQRLQLQKSTVSKLSATRLHGGNRTVFTFVQNCLISRPNITDCVWSNECSRDCIPDTLLC